MPLKYIKNEEGLFQCPDCGITKKNQNTMHYHMKKHEEQLGNICKICKKGFLQKQTLDLHIRSKHSDMVKDIEIHPKQFKCPIKECEFSSLTKGNCIIHYLRIHCQDKIQDIMTINDDNKTIHCNKCDNNFNNSCAFYYHCKKCITCKKEDANNMMYQEICS